MLALPYAEPPAYRTRYEAGNHTTGADLTVRYELLERLVEVVLKGGLVNWMRERPRER